ncbi:MAG: hypothetical protein ABFS09_13695 [Thermodesulfobacteriota bacterium]
MHEIQHPIPPEQIGFDIDCVVADTMEAFIRLADQEHNIAVLPEQITDFTVENCLPIDPEIIESIFLRLLDAPVKNKLLPMENAVPVLEKFASYAPLTFVTARPNRTPIYDWLAATLGPQVMTEARLVAMGDHNGKVDHIKDLGISYFIDDRFETCEEIAAHGITAIVYNQPWNENRHSLPTVRSWADIEALCALDNQANNNPPANTCIASTAAKS